MFRLAFAAYGALRRAGLNIDILPPDTADLSGYQLVLAPGVMKLSDSLRASLARFNGIALIGPRTDTKTDELAIPMPMGPALPNLDVTVALTESLPPQDKIKLQGGGRFRHWFEHLEGSAPVHLQTKTGQPAIMGGDHIRYLAGWPDPATFDRIITDLCSACLLYTSPSPRDRG